MKTKEALTIMTLGIITVLTGDRITAPLFGFEPSEMVINVGAAIIAAGMMMAGYALWTERAVIVQARGNRRQEEDQDPGHGHHLFHLTH